MHKENYRLKRPKVGLVFGGGGARGLAHIGVLKVIERERIPIDIICGTSAGSLIGAMYAQNPNVQQLELKMRRFLRSKEYKYTGLDYVVKKSHNESLFSQLAENIKERIVINIACSRKSIIGHKRLKKALSILLNPSDILETKIKLGIMTSDLVTGKGILFTKGDLINTVMASSSIPGFLPPVEMDGYQLMDGCVIHQVPIQAAFDMGADVVIAVDVSPTLAVQNEYDNIIDIMMRNSQMVAHAYNQVSLEYADVVIRPNVGDYHWAEFEDIDQIIAEGETAAQHLIWKIKKTTQKSYLVMRRINRSH